MCVCGGGVGGGGGGGEMPPEFVGSDNYCVPGPKLE